MQTLDQSIEELWNQYLAQDFRPDQIERKIYAQAKERKWPLPQVMKVLRQLRFPFITRQSQKKERPAYLFGCQQDDSGNTVDPFTLQDIPEEFLVSFEENEHRYCFDIRSVAKTIVQGSFSNPLTRSAFPDAVIQQAQIYIQSLTKTLYVGEERVPISTSLDSNFDMLIKILRAYDQGVLPALSKVNPFYEGLSLYTLTLTDQFVFNEADVINLYPFTDGVEQALAHKKLFEYCSKNRQEGGIIDTLFHELGFLLRIPPIFFNSEGERYLLDPDDTVYDTIRKIYIWLGGLEQVKKYSLVLDDGTPLIAFHLKRKACEKIPSLEIRYVYYDEDEDDALETKIALFERAFALDDEEFIRALADHPELRLTDATYFDVIDDMNYTLQDFVDYFWNAFLNKQEVPEQFALNLYKRTEEFTNALFNRPSSAEELVSFVKYISEQWFWQDQYNNWRAVLDKFGRETAVQFLYYFFEQITSKAVITSVLDGGLFPVAIQKSSQFALLDDIELFYRHYQHEKDLLLLFMIYDNKVRDYLLKNESPVDLLRVLPYFAGNLILQVLQDKIN